MYMLLALLGYAFIGAFVSGVLMTMYVKTGSFAEDPVIRCVFGVSWPLGVVYICLDQGFRLGVCLTQAVQRKARSIKTPRKEAPHGE